MIRSQIRSGIVFTLAVLVLTAGAATAVAATTNVDGADGAGVAVLQDDGDGMNDSDDEMDDSDEMNDSDGMEESDEMNDEEMEESDEMSDDEMDDDDDGPFGTVGFAVVGLLVVAGLGGVLAVRQFS